MLVHSKLQIQNRRNTELKDFNHPSIFNFISIKSDQTIRYKATKYKPPVCKEIVDKSSAKNKNKQINVKIKHSKYICESNEAELIVHTVYK